MGFLTHTSRQLTIALGFGFGAFLVMTFAIVLGRIIRDMRERYSSRNIKADEKLIFQFLETGDSKIALEMTRTNALRDHIVKIGRGLSGDLLSKLMILYTTLGFTRDDFLAMANGRRRKRLLALDRCRSFSMPLPEAAWPIMLLDNLPSARWAAMEYLVAAKGRGALPWVLHFIVQETANNTARKGVLIHITACLAQHTPEILPQLLDHLDLDAHREILLLVLARYPSMGAEHMIIRSMRLNSSDSLLLAGVQALAGHASSTSLAAVGALINHANAGIRQAVAEALRKFGDPVAAGLLAQLSVDSSYQVRLAAISSLVALQAEEELQVIASDPAHPGFLMWRRFAILQEIKEAA